MVDRSRQRDWPSEGDWPATSSFNPCCGGLVASTADDAGDRLSHSRFQSLLWWIGRVNLPRCAAECCTSRCFNPCCGGLVASTISTAILTLDVQAWVSILVVVDRSRQPGAPTMPGCATAICVFQSLLWWIGRVNGSPIRRQAARRPAGFNPCCGGLVASTVRRHLNAPAEADVSILVVVDWSRQPRCLQSWLIASCHRFQSLLWWIGRVNAAPWLPCGPYGMVSILVVVDWSRQRRPTIAA